MKLRNKKTGEIQEWECIGFYNPETVFDDCQFKSLAELNEG